MTGLPSAAVASRTCLLAFAVLGVLPPVVAAQQESLVADVEGAFARIDEYGDPMAASVNGLIPEPWYRATAGNLFGFRNHFQGIQRVAGTDYLVISGANVHAPMSSLFVLRMEGEHSAIVASIAVDPLLWHAGGMSVDGHVLAVPVYGDSPLRSQVVFYDVRDPMSPRRLPTTIDRAGEKAYAVALTRLPNGRHLAAILAGRDDRPRRLDFYVSESAEFSDGFAARPTRWLASEVQARDGQERKFSDFQTVNFVRQADGRLYLVGLHNTAPSVPFLGGKDYVDLFEVIVPDGMSQGEVSRAARPSVVKVASRRLYCSDGCCNLDAAGGLHVDPVTRALRVYAAPGWVDDDRVKFTEYGQR